MAINYKKEYKEDYEIYLISFRRMAKRKDYNALRMNVEQIKERDISPVFQHMAKEKFSLKLSHNASKHALRDFKNECHKKGFTIFGKRLKQGYIK